MRYIEMDFYNFIRQLNRFFQSGLVREAISKTAQGSKRSVAGEVAEVMEAVSKLESVMKLNFPKVTRGQVSQESVRIEAGLNPFNFMKVKVATHIMGSTDISAEKMSMEESIKKL